VAQFKFGMDAIKESESVTKTTQKTGEFVRFPSGTTFKVKLAGLDYVMSYYAYGVYKKVNTFVAANPSIRDAKGVVIENPTPWDLASKYYYDKARALLKGKSDKEADAIKNSKEYKDLTSEGYKYSGKQRFAVGFFDLETGKEIIVDFTRKQFNDVIKPVLLKFDAKKDKVAFELSKSGARNDTKIELMPLLDMDEDLSEKERNNFEKLIGKKFDIELFNGILYEATEEEQIKFLTDAGFDVSLIGFDANVEDSENDDVDEDYEF